MTQRHSFLYDESNNKKKKKNFCEEEEPKGERAQKSRLLTETKTPTRFEHTNTWEEDPDDGSLFFRDGAAFFFVRSKERRLGKERERIT